MTEMKTAKVEIPTKDNIEALFTLLQNSVSLDTKKMFLRITGNIEAAGWGTLCKDLSLAPSGWVWGVLAPVDLVRGGRRRNLRLSGVPCALLGLMGMSGFKKPLGKGMEGPPETLP